MHTSYILDSIENVLSTYNADDLQILEIINQLLDSVYNSIYNNIESSNDIKTCNTLTTIQLQINEIITEYTTKRSN